MSAQDKVDLDLLHKYWQACNYLAAGMIYLQDNPLLKDPLKPPHIKKRLIGHWGSSPALSFSYVHMNRAIKQFNINSIFLAGPGHGAPGVLAPVYLEGTYSEIYPDITEDEAGLQKFFKRFSFPGGIGSHCTPETPGSIHEGGELGYSVSHAFGAAFDNPDLIVTVVVGDGEAETGPLATSWHSNKFLNPITDGAVLPILNLNGYKINNPTLLSRIPHEELKALFEGYGWTPYFVEGEEPEQMHQQMSGTIDRCIEEIQTLQQQARKSGKATRQHWPMIILRTPKGWTGPTEVDGKKVAGSWRAHQVPLGNVRDNAGHLEQLEAWLKSYAPEDLFDEQGKLRAEIKSLAPEGDKRMSASPHVHGALRQDLILSDIADFAEPVETPGINYAENTRPLGKFLAQVMEDNIKNFRVFGPDENTSNKLDDIYQVSKKTWLAECFPEDEDGGELAADGRVMEMLSEHTLEGWLEGYLLTGRHGFFSTYEAFVHVIDSMFNQHAKWLAMSREFSWRGKVPSLNLLLTSTVWRQDHNGFTHQDPGFLDVVVNKSPEVTRIYLPPDVNSLLATAEHCLQTNDYVNVIVCDKQKHLQYLSIEAAREHCAKGVDSWSWASINDDGDPDIVIASAGDVTTKEALAAIELLHGYFPTLKIRYINVVDLYRLTPDFQHPHGLSDADFDALFTVDKTILFNFHAYPYLVHRLTYRRNGHKNLHVRGYTEKGNINTPLELAINNRIDRFSLVLDVLHYIPHLKEADAVRSKVQKAQQAALDHAYENGVDMPALEQWTWSKTKAQG